MKLVKGFLNNSHIQLPEDDPFMGLSTFKQIEERFQQISNKSAQTKMTTWFNDQKPQSEESLNQQQKMIQGSVPFQKQNIKIKRTHSQISQASTMFTTQQVTSFRTSSLPQEKKFRTISNFTQHAPNNNNESQFNQIPLDLNLIDDNQTFLDLFIKRIKFCANQCVDSSDAVLKDTEKIATEIGVPIHKLRQINSAAEREDFIIHSLINQVHDQLEQWKEKQKTKERDLKRKEQSMWKQKQQNSDIFEWIDIQSNFVSLRQKLKIAIVEAVSEQENQSQIQKVMNEKRSPTQKTSISNYPQPDIRAILNELTNLLNTVRNKISKPLIFDEDEKRKDEAKQKQRENNQTQQREQEMKVLEKAKINFKWSQKREEEFINTRKSARARLHNMVRSSSWNQSGFADLQRQCQEGSKNTLQREHLLNKYSNGDLLSAEEYQYIANTSELLNKWCDRDYIQKAISLLESNIITEIELSIAENILKSYFSMNNIIFQSRQNWLSQKNKKTRKSIQNYDVSHKINHIQTEGKLQNERVKKKLIAMLKQIRQKKQKERLKISKQQERFQKSQKLMPEYNNPYVWQFKEKMMRCINRKRRQYQKENIINTFLKRNYSEQKSEILFRSPKGNFTVESVKRITHPSSKLFISPSKKDIYNQDQYDRIKSLLQKSEKSFKLRLSKNQHEKIPENFKRFYSGGPEKARQYVYRNTVQTNLEDEDQYLDPSQKMKWVTKEIEVQAINKIKRAIRAFINRKRYQILVLEKELNRQKAVENKVRKYMESKTLLEFMSKKVGRKVKNSIGAQLSSGMQKMRDSVLDANRRRKSTLVPSTSNELLIQQNLNNDFKRKITQVTEKPIVPQVQTLNELPVKQRKLFFAVKMKSVHWARNSGFQFSKNDIDIYDQLGCTPLFYAAQDGNQEFCAFLINHGANVNLACVNGDSPLHGAFKSDNIAVINQLISAGGDLNATNQKGETPIHWGYDKTLQTLNLQNMVSFRTGNYNVKDNNVMHDQLNLNKNNNNLY